MDYENFEFLYGLSKEDIRRIVSMEGGKEFLDAYVKRAEMENGAAPQNIYNKALEKSLSKGRNPVHRKKKLSEEARIKILATIALIIVLLGSMHIDRDWKKGDGKASTSYSDINDENMTNDDISYKGRK